MLSLCQLLTAYCLSPLVILTSVHVPTATALPPSVIFKNGLATATVCAMAYFPRVDSSARAPRTSFSTPEPAEFRVEDRLVKGGLQRLSITGGYAVLEGKIKGGTLAEIEIPTPLGRIRGLIEFLDRRTGAAKPSERAFRFIGLDDTDFERLKSSLKQYG